MSVDSLSNGYEPWYSDDVILIKMLTYVNRFQTNPLEHELGDCADCLCVCLCSRGCMWAEWGCGVCVGGEAVCVTCTNAKDMVLQQQN